MHPKSRLKKAQKKKNLNAQYQKKEYAKAENPPLDDAKGKKTQQ